MSIAEALLARTPVIASRGTPWEALNTRRCGWWCGNDSSSLAAALENAFSLSPQERLAMGERKIPFRGRRGNRHRHFGE